MNSRKRLRRRMAEFLLRAAARRLSAPAFFSLSGPAWPGRAAV
jgi:hypothetical protein